jgi:hypothetical protein
MGFFFNETYLVFPKDLALSEGKWKLADGRKNPDWICPVWKSATSARIVL